MKIQDLKEYKPLTEEEIEKYWPLVTSVASKYANSNKIDHLRTIISKEDLEAELYTALLEAIRKYDPNNKRNLSIEVWIYNRCCQRLIDYIRSKSWVHHITYKKLRDKNETIKKIISDSEFTDSTLRRRGTNNLFDDIDFRDLVEHLFSDLPISKPDQAQVVLSLYYVQKFTVKEISKTLGFSKCKVFSIISSTKPYLKQRLNIHALKCDESVVLPEEDPSK